MSTVAREHGTVDGCHVPFCNPGCHGVKHYLPPRSSPRSALHMHAVDGQSAECSACQVCTCARIADLPKMQCPVHGRPETTP